MQDRAQDTGGLIPRSLFVFALLYGGLAVLAGVLGTKLASLGHWPLLGDLAVESGIFAFLLLVVMSSAVAEPARTWRTGWSASASSR
jgi:queuosine precursor transporter